MSGRPKDLTKEQQNDAFELLVRAVDLHKSKGVADRLGVQTRTVDRWRRGAGISQRHAVALHRLMTETLREGGLHSGPDGRALADELPRSLQGIPMAIAFLQAREEAGILFPNLAAAVRFDEGQAPAERRSWSKAAIVAAAGGAMGDEDLTTGEWCRALDAIEEALARVRKGLERPATPAPKRLHP